MILPDVNVLVVAFKEEAEYHTEVAAWLDQAAGGAAPFGLAGVVVSSFVRIVTHPRVFVDPAQPDAALDFLSVLRRRPNVLTVHPSKAHLDVFDSLCRRTQPRGNLVSDVYLAALAVDAGATVATLDRDFARFPDVRWSNPLER